MYLPVAMNDVWELKLKAGAYMVKTIITKRGERLEFQFPFNRLLMAEVKEMQGAKYHGYDDNPRKIWSVTDSLRNRFRIAFMAYPDPKDPRNPYYWYDRPVVQAETRRQTYKHQGDMFRNGLTYHYDIWAAEMGTGKTLAAIELMEASRVVDWIWVGPKSALFSVQLEFEKWKALIRPSFYTFEGLKKLVEKWPQGKKAPQGLIIDEASRVRNPTAQRSAATFHLAESIRNEWGRDGYVIEMSGSPAPKSPVDWWHLCEIAQPGFLREGSQDKMKRRMAIIENREQFSGGGVYPHLVTWKDDPAKCDICGLPIDGETHGKPDPDFDQLTGGDAIHEFVPSKNEVLHLYERMKPLVIVKFKKDCLDLPDKIYKEIVLKPSRATLNAAAAIQAKSPSTIQALTLLRELSDGFQYVDVPNGMMTCPLCDGTKQTLSYFDANDPDNPPTMEEIEIGYRITDKEDGNGGEPNYNKPIKMESELVNCYRCGGEGEVPNSARAAEQIATPKESALLDILDEHDDVGRLVVYGGFTGSLDRITAICQSVKWHFIRVDGRGWFSDLLGTPLEMLRKFQEGQVDIPRICFIGQPGAAGMGLTLTASPTIVYYSNDFNAESRIQSEDRIHRVGMDVARGATIIDLIHLPSDKLVLDNLKKKRRLQDMSMGELNVVMSTASETPIER